MSHCQKYVTGLKMSDRRKCSRSKIEYSHYFGYFYFSLVQELKTKARGCRYPSTAPIIISQLFFYFYIVIFDVCACGKYLPPEIITNPVKTVFYNIIMGNN